MNHAEETYVHPELGELTLRRSARAVRLSITVRPTAVIVTLPHGVSVGDALAFVESKSDWIVKAVARSRKRAPVQAVIVPPFSTRLHTLVLRTHGEARYDIRIRGGEVVVTYPDWMKPGADGVQKMVRKGLEEAYRIEARRLLPGRVEALAEEHGFRYRGLTFRNSVSRWGSCSATDGISLSIHLMTLPDRLVDYIILHELCHTVEKNHGTRFHKLLDRVTGGQHPVLRKELKKYTTRW